MLKVILKNLPEYFPRIGHTLDDTKIVAKVKGVDSQAVTITGKISNDNEAYILIRNATVHIWKDECEIVML